MQDDERRIVLIEDDPRDVELITSALEEEDLDTKVIVLRDGEEALHHFFPEGDSTTTPPNPLAIFMDIKMPKIGGLEVLRKLRHASSPFRFTPVVILSSSKEPRDIEEAYESGVNAYIAKPVAFQEFFSTVRTMGLFWCNLNQTLYKVK